MDGIVSGLNSRYNIGPGSVSLTGLGIAESFEAGQPSEFRKQMAHFPFYVMYWQFAPTIGDVY